MLLSLRHSILPQPTRSLSTLMSSSTPSRTRAPRHRNPRRHANAATAATAPAQLLDVSSSSSSTPVVRPTTPAAMVSNFSSVRFRDFAERGQISDQVLRGIPFEFCTHVQAETLGVLLKGTDVYVSTFFFQRVGLISIRWQACARENGNGQDAGLSHTCHPTARVVHLPPATPAAHLCAYTLSNQGVSTADREGGAHSPARVGIDTPSRGTMCSWWD